AGAGGAEGRGRGLDAYRSAPIMVVGQAVAAPRPAAAAMPAAAATPSPARMAFAAAPPGAATPGAGTLPIMPSRPSPLAFFRRPG
uniref:hypothetical protein n=1 Tax=Neoroseomonas rubea TaxID=2748666 RepID=UPI0018DF82A6